MNEYICDRCGGRVESWRVVSVRLQHGSVIIEHYCECLLEPRVSVFDEHPSEVERLCAQSDPDLPWQRVPPPCPQFMVEQRVSFLREQLERVETLADLVDAGL